MRLSPRHAWLACLVAVVATLAPGCDRSSPSPTAEKMQPQGIESEFRPAATKKP